VTATPTPPTPTPVVTRRKSAWVSTAIAIVFGLFFAYDLFEAVANLLGVPPLYNAAGLTPPWALLVVNAVIPVAAFGIALLLGRKKRLFVKLVLFVVALCAVAVLSLDAVALLPYA